MSLAADLPTQPGASVTAVSAQVGHASPFALSTAFKRRYGLCALTSTASPCARRSRPSQRRCDRAHRARTVSARMRPMARSSGP